MRLMVGNAVRIYLFILLLFAGACKSGNDQKVTPDFEVNIQRFEQDLFGISIYDVADSIQGLGDATVEVMFEGRTISVVGGTFTDDFAPYDRHVYRIVP